MVIAAIFLLTVYFLIGYFMLFCTIELTQDKEGIWFPVLVALVWPIVLISGVVSIYKKRRNQNER